MRVAVVTPYYKEPLAQLRQCIKSVREQTVPCTQILVADGHPNSSIKITGAMEHVILPRSNADSGNTPRGIGGLLADSWGFDAIAFLDADNWCENDHVETLIRVQRETGRPLVACRRTFFTLDGVRMNYAEHSEITNAHVDTNCWLITRDAFPLIKVWFMPRPLGPVGDRVFFQKAQRDNYAIAFTGSEKVAYRTAYVTHYLDMGMTPPRGSKPNVDWPGIQRYVADPSNHPEMMSKLGFIPSF